MLPLWEDLLDAQVPKAERPPWAHKLSRVAQVTLIAAIATAIGASSSTSGNTPPATIITVRKASSLLALAVVVIAALAVVRTHLHYSLDTRPTALLLLILALCAVIAVYRVVQVFSTGTSAPVRSRAAFYILQGAFEVFAIVCYLAVNLDTWFPRAPKDPRPADTEDMNLVHKAEPSRV